MTITTSATETQPRVRLFYGLAVASLIIGLATSIGGGSVKPLLDVPALVAEQPADAGAPAAQEPAATTAPASADVCTVGTAAFTRLTCGAAALLGLTLSAPSAEITPGSALTVAPEGALAPGRVITVPRFQEGTIVVLKGGDGGTATAAEMALPAQSDASIATDIRAALGVPEIYFLTDGKVAGGPNINFGPGWAIATKFDAARPVGTVVPVGPRTLTVTTSDPAMGTFYAVN